MKKKSPRDAGWTQIVRGTSMPRGTVEGHPSIAAAKRHAEALVANVEPGSVVVIVHRSDPRVKASDGTAEQRRIVKHYG